MEWVETTGKTVEEAKDAALDQLGVDEQDAEFEIIEEAKSGLFGLTRREARVRARVQPTSPRPKTERRDRRRRQTGSESRGPASGSSRAPNGDAGGDSQEATQAEAPTRGRRPKAAAADTSDAPEPAQSATETQPKPRRSGRTPARSSGRPAPSEARDNAEGNPVTSEDVTVEEQAEIISEFVKGLVDAYGLEGEIHHERIDEDTIEIQVSGDDLGLLIGPKGQTLAAIQDLSRTVVQRQATGTHHGRVRLDVSGYRQRRREALERFARSVADDVKASGVQKALEPMNAADRKVVHDTINDIDGVSTVSEGEDQRRRVVIVPVS